MKRSIKCTILCTVVMLSGLFLFGCMKDDGPVSQQDSAIVLEDAAESVAGAVGDESGGSTENIADAFMLAQAGGSIGTTTPLADGGFEMTRSGVSEYDSTTGYWTVTIDRQRSNGIVTASYSRVYRYRFSKNGVVQKNYITGNDTATTLQFKIVSGSGYFKNPRVTHYLTKLSGSWIATDINKDTVTVNSDSTYVRVGVDSIQTRNMLRTFTHELTLNFANVKGPRFKAVVDPNHPKRQAFANAISGTATGTYKATITMQRGDLYKDRSIDRTFTITFGGGEGTIGFGGSGSFKFGMKDGQRKP